MARGGPVSKAAGTAKSISYLCVPQQVLLEAAGHVAHIPWGMLCISLMLNLCWSLFPLEHPVQGCSLQPGVGQHWE